MNRAGISVLFNWRKENFENNHYKNLYQLFLQNLMMFIKRVYFLTIEKHEQ